MSHGVGIVGAGPGVAALHLPTLARLGADFEVVHISDGGSGRAEDLAARVGARWSSELPSFSPTRVAVVVLCSPPAQHAGQILASVAAGKRAVLCEKPLATTVADAEAVIDACRDAGDRASGRHQPPVRPGLGAGEASPPRGGPHRPLDLGDTGAAAQRRATTMSSQNSRRRHPLPVGAAPNSRCRRSRHPSFVSSSRVSPCTTCRCSAISRRVSRRSSSRARSPRSGTPSGYRASRIPVRLTTVMLPEGADAVWRLDITTETDLIEVSFPPAFVHVGSAVVRVTTPTGKRTSIRPRPKTDTSPSGEHSQTFCAARASSSTTNCSRTPATASRSRMRRLRRSSRGRAT